MKIIFILSGLLICSFCLSAQNEEAIAIGKKEIIASKLLNENRTIWVYTPNFTSQHVNPDKRYPVMYLLDGGAHFFSTVGIIQQLSQANGNGILPEMIVVAIESTNRLKDFVPDDLTKLNPFEEFLTSELIPFIDKKYKTAPYKLLAGHSLGGLTAINLLTRSPQSFNAYIAIDPSMWYDNEKFLNHTIAQLHKQPIKGRKLFIGTANTMPRGMTLSQLKTDQSNETQHIRSIFRLNEYLKTNSNGLLYAQKYYDEEKHNSVPLLSEYDGLRFIFDYYALDISENEFADSTTVIASKLKTHYVTVSAELGYKNAAPETLINYLAYDALGKQQFNKAKSLFELNQEWYPESSNVYDSYAAYFLAQKDTINAIANYRKALAFDTTTIFQKKLDALIVKKTTTNVNVDLQKYAGTYTLETFQLDIVLAIRAGKLWAVVPGQEDDELQSITENVFTVKGKQGYTITFQMNGDKPLSFTSVQPNGTFKAVIKKR
jgi:predicted alpha/beta superfamily hydrolase